MGNTSKFWFGITVGLLLTSGSIAYRFSNVPSMTPPGIPKAPGDRYRNGESIFKALPQPEIRSFQELLAAINKNGAKIKDLKLETRNGQLLSVKLEETNGAFSQFDVPAGPINSHFQDLVLHCDKLKWSAEALESSPAWLLNKLAPSILITLLLLLFLAYSRSRGGPLQMFQGKGNFMPASSNVKFADVAGNDEAKERLQRTVTFLKHPNKLKEMGGRLPKGTLLFGPAGTGKTLLAKAVAGEAGLPFYAVSGSDFVEKFVGVGASRMRELFSLVRRTGGILFFDEIDAVGKERGGPNSHDERDQTLNALLEEMDGIDPLPENVHVIAATNRLEILDRALLRPNRFDSQIPVLPADEEGRYQILMVHTKNKKLAKGVNLRLVARRAKGFSGAKLEGACNEAVIFRLEENERQRAHLLMEGLSLSEIDNIVQDELSLEDLFEGIDCIEIGPRSKRVKPDEELKQVAYHEVGHAIVGQVLHNSGRGGSGVAKITIDGRVNAGGYTAWDQEDLTSCTLAQLEAMGKACMGGRAAQELCLTTVDTGASNDFEKAYEIAQHIVTTYGMSSKFGPLSLGGKTAIGNGPRTEGFKPGTSLQNEIDREVLRLINSWMDEAKKIICQEKVAVEAAVKLLLRKKTLLAEEWTELFDEHATILSGNNYLEGDHSVNCRRCGEVSVVSSESKHSAREFKPGKLRMIVVNAVQLAVSWLSTGSRETEA